MAKKNYYDILGVPEDATEDQLKKAYRKRAVEFHPDKNPGDEIAAGKFRSATEAYEILKDPSKRAKYDKKPRSKKRKFSRKGADLKIVIKALREDLIYQKKKVVIIKRKGLCPHCKGTASAVKRIKECNFCGGTGLQGLALAMGHRRKCINCDGAGGIPEGDPCPKCYGAGVLPEKIHREIQLNPFSEFFTLEGLGNCCFCGDPGDLIIQLNITEDPVYRVKGLNITRKIQLSPAQAILGDKIKMDVFGKRATINIPSGVQNNEVLDMERSGIIYKDRVGIFRAEIEVKIPKIITEKNKTLYQEILKNEKEISWPMTLTC